MHARRAILSGDCTNICFWKVSKFERVVLR